MSPEVLIIILVLTIPIYFFCLWFLRKLKIGNEHNRRYIAIIPTVVFSPIVYVGLFIIWFFSITYYPNKDFDRDEWNSNVEKRYEMSEDIMASNILIGKKRDEVIVLLGSDFYAHGENNISYELGYVPGLWKIDPDYIDIYFENGKVTKVEQH